MAAKRKAEPNSNRITRFLHVVEWLGNALPHPVTLFALFAASVVVFSGILAYFDVAVVDPRPAGAKGRADNGLIEVVSLMNAEGLRMIVLNLVRNFVEFAPLGTVLVALLGVGVAERSGWLTAVIRGMVLKAPPKLVTVIIVFAGVLSNTASEMGYVVLVPLAAVVFYSLGRHPLAGLLQAESIVKILRIKRINRDHPMRPTILPPGQIRRSNLGPIPLRLVQHLTRKAQR